MLLRQIKGCVWLYQCDWCGKQFERRLVPETIKTHGCSRSCSSRASRATVKANLMAKYGVENVSQLPEVREKVKQTSLERYGVECSWQNENVKKRIKESMIARYGADSPWRVPEIREKIEADNLKKYGVKHVWENQEIREKSKQTMLELYGVDNPQKSPEIQARTRQTCVNRYGVENPQQSQDIVERTQKTCMVKYGAKNPFGSSVCREKARLTLQKHYGIDNPSQSPEIQRKILKSFLGKGRGFVSRAELRCLNVLRELYGDVTHQKPINGWMIDFYVNEHDVYVQFDGVYWHGLTLTKEQRTNPTSKRECDITRKWTRDREQDMWFVTQKKRLMRITDEQYKNHEDEGQVKEFLRSVVESKYEDSSRQ